jgi:glycosyltransferase involved in cell wall biosynthesis
MAVTPVSVLLPVKNGIRFWPDAETTLRSYLRPEDELVIVDDSSTDGSLEFANKLATKMPNVKVLKNSGSGLVSALNYGLTRCTNTWVARHDIDDSYAAERLDVQTEKIETGTVLIFSDYSFVSPSGISLGIIPSAITPTAMKISLITSQRTAHPSALFRRESVIESGGYRSQDFPAEDLSLWLRLARIGDIRSTPQTLLRYRLSPDSISAQRRAEMIRRTAELREQFKLSEEDMGEFLQNLDDTFIEYNNATQGNIRKILSIRDIFLIPGGKKAIASSARLQYEIFKILAAPKSAQQIQKFWSEKRARANIRNWHAKGAF